MREILLIVGSGVDGGNTDRLADAFAEGATKAGHHVHKAFLGNMEISGCRGCGACQIGNSHQCSIPDAMHKIYPLFNSCDMVVLASPLYFWTISAQLKAFIERLYACSEQDMYPKKSAFLLMTAGDDTFWTFEQAVSYYRFVIGALGWDNLGMYLAGGCDGTPGKHQIAEAQLKEAMQAGENL